MKFIYTILNTINTTYNPWNSTIRYPQWATNPNKVFYLIGFRSNINCSTVYICLLICGFCGQKKKVETRKTKQIDNSKIQNRQFKAHAHTHHRHKQVATKKSSSQNRNIKKNLVGFISLEII